MKNKELRNLSPTQIIELVKSQPLKAAMMRFEKVLSSGHMIEKAGLTVCLQCGEHYKHCMCGLSKHKQRGIR
jgi:hypothetical protein